MGRTTIYTDGSKGEGILGMVAGAWYESEEKARQQQWGPGP